MAKQGMKRPDYTQVKPRNEETPVPEIQGSAKSRNEKAKPVTERRYRAPQKNYRSRFQGQEMPLR